MLPRSLSSHFVLMLLLLFSPRCLYKSHTSSFHIIISSTVAQKCVEDRMLALGDNEYGDDNTYNSRMMMMMMMMRAI